MAVEGKTHSISDTTPANSKEHTPNLGQSKFNSISKPNDIDWDGFTLYLSNSYPILVDTGKSANIVDLKYLHLWLRYFVLYHVRH